MFDPARLVFIDETCTNTAMVRLRGRAPRGERLVGYAPHGHRKTITFVGGLRQRGMTAPFALEGAMNGPMFLVYVKQCLAPTLNRREIVLMDHPASQRTRDALPTDGARSKSVSSNVGSWPRLRKSSIRNTRAMANSWT